MIYGVGTDIVAIDRVKQGLERFGERFAERILAEEEMAGFIAAAGPAHFLAKRFAAKEAAAKALGTGFRDGLSLRHIAVTHDRLGKPVLSFTAKADRLITELGVGESHLSLSDEAGYAVAFVVLMRRAAG